MEDLVRERMHAALDVEPTPAYLRSRIMSSLPVVERPRPSPAPGLDWARTWVAALLVLAIVAGFAYVAHQIGNQTVHHSPRPIVPAKLWQPQGLVIGPDGLVYFADSFSGYVFRRQPDGSLVTVAGTRPAVSITQGDAGNGGPATQAYLFGPLGLAFDQSGNLYIADAYADRVRKIDRRGVISTEAGSGIADSTFGTFGGDGGPATAANLDAPTAVAVDAQGVVYVADFANRKVRTIDRRGVISSLDESAIPMSVSYFHPHDLAFDAAGDLYVGSGDIQNASTGRGCEVVRRTPDGFWSRVAGTGVCGSGGIGGPALDAQIGAVGGLAVDAAGNLYFADTFHHRILRVDGNGILTTVLVDNEYPTGIAISRGTLYVAEAADLSLTPSGPGRIQTVDLASGTVTTIVDSNTPIHTSG